MNTAKQSGKNLVQPFSEILKNVGIVTQALTPNRVKVNLGSKFQAAAGQRFRVFSGRKAYCDNLLKGEIVLVEIGSEESTAEILYHNDPSSNMEFADRIVYIELEQSIRHSIPKIKEQNSSGINSLEILPLEEFIQYWHSHCRHTSQFCMILCRIKEEEAEKSPDDANNEFTQLYADISRVLQTSLPAEGKIGEYSSNSLIIYMPEIDPKQAEETANKIFKPSSKKQSAPLVLGIAFYPCSHFHRTDMLINCRKAFEHALLLPSFQFAFFNSTSLTISADRHFIHNDLSNAISEYKTALLLDPQNSTAKNSLGICLAKLGQLNSAFNEFKQVAEQEPNNHFVLYNLGYTYLRLNCYPEAKQCFQKCIEHAQCTEEEEIRPEHIFSLLRLGEIAEKKQEFEQAKEFYLQALDKKQGSEYAYLFLGNLEFKLGNRENAKYYLQQALVQNPQDAEAMHLLAKIYLEQGEDPEVAESLAQKSIELRPQANDYRRLLVKALLHQNKEKEAKTLENSLGTDSNQLSLSMPT